MPELAFVISPRQNWHLREFVETLRYELDQQGVPSTLHTAGFPEPRLETVYVLVAPHEYLALEGADALPYDEILGRTILLCAQPPHALRLDEGTEHFRRAGAVFDIDQRSVALFRRAGIPARHLRPGYSKLRDMFNPATERPIDVMFLGAHSVRRSKQLNRCAPILARHNCLLQLSDDSHPNPVASTSFLAEAKWDLLTRTNVLLNIHRGEDSYLEWLRVLDAIHTGAVVVSEHSSGMAPLVEGEHLLVASPESLPYVLDAALRDAGRLQQLRSSAYERIRFMLPFALSVSVFRAAAVEIIGRPLSRTASLGRRAASLPDLPRTPPRLDGEAEAAAMREGLREMNIEVIQLRREITRLEQIIRSGGDAPRITELVDETPTWSARSKSRVTVITAVSDDSEFTRPTIDSLAQSWFRDFELVVVVDASTNSSVDVVAEWMRLNPEVPAILVRQGAGRGFGAARNTALEFARSGYCLTLDPGDQVYPRCMEVLVGVLDGIADTAFAYPMVEVCGITDTSVRTGGGYLLGVFGWDAGRLRLGTRVQGLTLFRTELLHELGGYATEPHLSGWEDFDLWCRVAEHGWRGQHVPQILGRHRRTLAQRASIAALTRTAPVSILLERAPGVLAGATQLPSR